MSSLWVFLSTLMVLAMVFGLALTGAGMVRQRNSLSQIMQILTPLPFLSLLFLFFGFSLIFSPKGNSFIGFWQGMGWEGFSITGKADQLNSGLFFFFQMSFALVSPLLLIGTMGERVSFKKSLLFVFIWSILVYYPVAYWVWGIEGWIHKLNGHDLAGGLVVHISAGFSALALSLKLRRRQDYFKLLKKYNNSLILLGTFFLWIGWFGFNGGSVQDFNETTIKVILNTWWASIASLMIWILIDLLHTPHKTYMSGFCLSLICGLVSITPGADLLNTPQSLLTGALAGFLGNYSIRYMHKVFNQDDVLEVFSSHGVCGLLGAISVGFFFEDHFKGNLLGSLAVALYSFIFTFFLITLFERFSRFRIQEKDEAEGLDLIEHGEQIINLNRND